MKSKISSFFSSPSKVRTALKYSQQRTVIDGNLIVAFRSGSRVGSKTLEAGQAGCCALGTLFFFFGACLPTKCQSATNHHYLSPFQKTGQSTLESRAVRSSPVVRRRSISSHVWRYPGRGRASARLTGAYAVDRARGRDGMHAFALFPPRTTPTPPTCP